MGAAIPEKLGLSFAVPLTFLALLVNDFRKFINVIVIIVSGFVATLGYNYIPFKAYAIVAGLTGLLVAKGKFHELEAIPGPKVNVHT